MISNDPPFDPRRLRTALGRFPTGVTVITTCTAEGRREGLTANSFAALSLDPALVLWSLGKRAPSLAGFRAAGRFAVNVLGAGQADLSHHFATPREDKFAGVAIETGVGGCPLIQGALARFECATREAIEAGDHVLFIGEVLRFAYDEGPALAFSAGGYGTVLPMARAGAGEDAQSIWAGLG